MLVFAGNLLLLAMSAAPLDAQNAVCEVGRLALADLPSIERGAIGEKFYSGRTDRYHRDLLEACPALAGSLPAGFRPATDETFRRRGEIVSRTPVSIFDVEVPTIDATATRATVRMGYTCNGTCGARFEAVYVWGRAGWRRDGAIQIVSVS